MDLKHVQKCILDFFLPFKRLWEIVKSNFWSVRYSEIFTNLLSKKNSSFRKNSRHVPLYRIFKRPKSWNEKPCWTDFHSFISWFINITRIPKKTIHIFSMILRNWRTSGNQKNQCCEILLLQTTRMQNTEIYI